MDEIGFNDRLPDLACALGVSQLQKLPWFVQRRAALIQSYENRLSSLGPAIRRVPAANAQRPGWHLCSVLIDFAAAGIDRASVMRRLLADGVGSQVHYIPVCWQPYYRDRYGEVDLPGAAAYYARTLSLPLFPSMSEADVDRVVDSLRHALHS
jgi:dTDP-4-amino-4,6-dideoxygalactose transaminase